MIREQDQANAHEKASPPGCCDEEACCSADTVQHGGRGVRRVGTVASSVGGVPRVTGKWNWRDWFGTLKVRMGIGRMDYRIPAGLYALGAPDEKSPVFVTANYKKSFDHLRRDLKGEDGWILVLDTNGINVWCAAGKGTFGTEELLRRIETTSLAGVVTHRELIVPQLGAPGVAAHEVRQKSGFRVVYGPVRSADLRDFLEAGCEATGGMREVSFPLADRMALVPVEFFGGLKYVLAVLAVLLVLGGIEGWGYSLDAVWSALPLAAVTCALGLVAGAVLTPAFLPFLPGRAFSLKGAFCGLLASMAVAGACVSGGTEIIAAASVVLLATPIASAYAMNFTGASTFTSLSGVRREMRAAVPLQVIAGLVGLVLWTLT